MPFQHYLREYFSMNRKHGSRDRKNITNLCYQYYRLGRSLEGVDLEKKLRAAIDFNAKISTEFEPLSSITGEAEFKTAVSTLKSQQNEFDEDRIFDFDEALSDGIDRKAFCLSHLVQPLVYVRIRPGAEEKVREQLRDAGILYINTGEFSLAVSPSAPLDKYLHINRDVVIQDISSQNTSEFFPPVADLPKEPSVWDCCAASGGKSMLAVDMFKAIRLTVSDIRDSIIINLRKRFAEAGITRYSSFVTDLSATSGLEKEKYDLVIADLPCTGSGTWGRTPENLVHFKQKEVERYSALQLDILTNVSKSVKRGSYLLYVTCSVFRSENEEVLEEFSKNKREFETKKVAVIKGYHRRADTMFACLMKRH